MAMRSQTFGEPRVSIWQKLWQIHWLFILLLTAVASVGFVMLYSAAGGSIEPWTIRQMMRFGAGVVGMICVAIIDIRIWLKYAYVLYAVAVVLLIAVDVSGTIGMGAQRWLDLGIISLQPSELMKVALILALARYFHGGTLEEIRNPLFLIPPLFLVMVPVGLVMKQPDLGTAVMLMAASGILFFLAGVRLWKFAIVIVAGAGMLPIAWQFLREYQKQRVITFLNPENDPLGSGYHIIQSKIALGSGGVFGKGFIQGTQSHLNFLPEMQTDFIFTMLAEEFGMVGGLGLLGLYLLVLIYGFAMSLACRNQFGRLLGLGLTSMFFLYIFINVAMVMGLIPVVGVPLPLVSYGGTAMLSLLFAFGLVLGVYVHRDVAISRRAEGDD